MQVFQVKVNHNTCTGCNVCVVSCPINFNQLRKNSHLNEKNAVILVKNGIAKPIFVEDRNFNCDGCGVCVKACPQVAIRITCLEEA
ncbi:MAG: 4Fe-4S dicluster domain-containing protein [Candidatus Lokiarchaeota archaeon]|nr:4Fe-4S dicluster domain-containing protein [Candidatus Lokiarchaeota archaeon]MBD3342116.1 4Fe-4S dicluster domain-containing protein [Candidatus Lokiarchaeota archaeon]